LKREISRKNLFKKEGKPYIKTEEKRPKKMHECMVAWMNDLTIDRRQQTAAKDRKYIIAGLHGCMRGTQSA
jgi:hypothetical protein